MTQQAIIKADTATALTVKQDQTPTATDLTARDVFNIWLADQSKLTRTVYKAEVAAFLEWAGKPAPDVHIGDVVSYKQALTDRSLAPATIAKKLSALRSFYKVCHAQGLTPTNPTAGVKLPRVKDETSKDILSLAEVEKLFAQVDTSTVFGLRDRAILALMLVNGLREVEIARANYGDLKEVDGIKVLVVHGKKDREDETVLRDDVHQVLMDYLSTRGELEPSTPLFVGVNHRAHERMSTRAVRHRIDNYLRQAGLKREGISGHSLRHTAITWPILAGASLVQAMELARHADHPQGKIINVGQRFADGSIRLVRDIPVGTPTWKRLYHRAHNASKDRNATLEGWRLTLARLWPAKGESPHLLG